MPPIGELQAYVRGLRGQLIALDGQLAPVNRREDEIKRAIRATLDPKKGWTPGGKVVRAPLYDELTELHRKYGQVRAERRQVAALVRVAMRELERLERSKV